MSWTDELIAELNEKMTRDAHRVRNWHESGYLEQIATREAAEEARDQLRESWRYLHDVPEQRDVILRNARAVMEVLVRLRREADRPDLLDLSPIGRCAVQYAEGGALVLPLHTPTSGTRPCSCLRRDCAHPGKHPRVLNGKDDATSDVERVRSWWRMWPEANIGVRPHPGQVVLDVDPRNGGREQIVAMQQTYGRLPVTRTVLTGSGGWHLWHLFDGPIKGALAPGIDLKGHAGYVVVPPSVHASGVLYTWANAGPIAPAPAYLHRFLAPKPLQPRRAATGTASPKVLDGLVRTVREAQEGNRNRALFWSASRAHERGLDVEPLIEAAVEVGLARREAEGTVESAAKGSVGSG